MLISPNLFGRVAANGHRGIDTEAFRSRHVVKMTKPDPDLQPIEPGENSLRVLLVDDSEDELWLLEDELIQGGYRPQLRRVDTAPQMEAALDDGEWDVLIVDYVMPAFSGPAALQIYNRRALDIPLIVVSGKMGEETAVEMMRAGAKDYIIKQNRSRLIPAIRRELEEYRSRRARLAAEQALLEARNRLAVITESARDAILMLDEQGNIEYWNPSATRIFGYRAQDVAGRNVRTILIGSFDEATHAFLPPGEKREQTDDTLELDALHKDARCFPVELSFASFQQNGQWQTVAVIRDISQRKQMEQALEDLATHDALTGLFNRAQLEKRLQQEVDRARRYGRVLSLFFLDLDHFKTVNDRFGHQAGDALLKGFADLLCSEVRQVDFVGRYGGEEFVIIMPETTPEQALETAERLRARVADQDFELEPGGRKLSITVSIGIGAIPNHGRTMEALIQAADAAMYRAKQAGRDRVHMASGDDRSESASITKRTSNA